MLEIVKGWGKKQWLIGGIVVLVVAAGISSLFDEPKPGPAPVAIPTVTTPSPSLTPTPTEAEPMTTGGISYFEAAAACDNYLRLQLPGRKYKSHQIIGKRGGMVGIEPDQFIATYDAKIDGAGVVVTCVVKGTASAVEVLDANIG